MEDKERKKVVTVVSTPGGYFTPARVAGVTTQTEADLDKIVGNLLKDVDVPVFKNEE